MRTGEDRKSFLVGELRGGSQNRHNLSIVRFARGGAYVSLVADRSLGNSAGRRGAPLILRRTDASPRVFTRFCGHIRKDNRDMNHSGIALGFEAFRRSGRWLATTIVAAAALLAGHGVRAEVLAHYTFEEYRNNLDPTPF